jgi:uncharacterized protein with GYD domain
MGVKIKELYLTTGEDDFIGIIDSPNEDNVAKLAISLAMKGNVRTRTCRAWSQSEFKKLISEVP